VCAKVSEGVKVDKSQEGEFLCYTVRIDLGEVPTRKELESKEISKVGSQWTGFTGGNREIPLTVRSERSCEGVNP
jgi:hypothetical protein